MGVPRRWGGTAVTSLPKSLTVPSVGSSRPAIMRTVVVLPDPLGPIMEKNSPWRTEKEIESNATVSPNKRDTSSNSTTESGASDCCTPSFTPAAYCTS